MKPQIIKPVRNTNLAQEHAACIAALDALAVALAAHKHKWTRKERNLYQTATRYMQP